MLKAGRLGGSKRVQNHRFLQAMLQSPKFGTTPSGLGAVFVAQSGGTRGGLSYFLY
jgi:hypothetical protein